MPKKLEGSTHQQIYELLKYADGLTTFAIAEKLQRPYASIVSALYRMRDAYIDRYEISPTGRKMYRAVWCVVVAPAHCPHPRIEAKQKNSRTWDKPQRKKMPALGGQSHLM